MIQLRENLLGHKRVRLLSFLSKHVMGLIHREKLFSGISTFIWFFISSQMVLIKNSKKRMIIDGYCDVPLFKYALYPKYQEDCQNGWERGIT